MAHPLYSTAAWRTARIAAIAKAGGRCTICQCILKAGRKHPQAAEVDHITPHRGDRELFFDRSNHQALCKQCHSSHKARIERGKRMQRDDGW